MNQISNKKAQDIPQPRVAPNPGQSAIPTNQKLYRIFFVDDDLMMQKMLARTFSKNEALDIHVFPTGELCISQLDALPDIIVLDYHLSIYDEKVMNGLDVLLKIKKLKPETKVIMLSSQNEVSIAVECLKKGALDYIVKDDTMKINIKRSVSNVIQSMELKEEIQSLSETVKRDKLLIRGYSILILLLITLVSFLILG